jgi:hypothetical protein
LRPTQSAVTPEQLARIRRQVAYAIGIGRKRVARTAQSRRSPRHDRPVILHLA